MFNIKLTNEKIIQVLTQRLDSKPFGQIPFCSDLKNQNTVLPEFTFFQIIIINDEFILFFGFCNNQKKLLHLASMKNNEQSIKQNQCS